MNGQTSAEAGASDASASGTGTSGPAFRTLSEERGLELLRAAFQTAGVEGTVERRIQLADGQSFAVDLAEVRGHHGVEFVSTQDEATIGLSLPERRSANALVTFRGAGRDADFTVLVLRASEYRYDAQTAGALQAAEDRLRQAVVGYFHYLRQHGQL